MKTMKIEGKYRILRHGEHLPEEILQTDMDNILSRLRGAVQEVCDIIEHVYQRDDVASDMVSGLMDASCLSYNDGHEWHLDCLVDEIGQMQKILSEQDDDIPSYEDSETIFDEGFQGEMYGRDNGIYVSHNNWVF